MNCSAVRRILFTTLFSVSCFVHGLSNTSIDLVLAHENITILDGNNQVQKTGQWLQTAFTIQLADSAKQPVAGVRVNFGLLSEPDVNTKYQFSKSSVITDTLGIAKVEFKTGTKAGKYEIIARPSGAYSDQMVVFTVHVKRSNWVRIMIIGLLGGLALFIFGMEMMSEGLQNSAGDRMQSILSKLTYNRLIAVSVGAFVTMVIQSSSATNVMLVGFVNSKLMRFRQTIGVMLGAAIGTTITAQIIAFKFTDYALVFVTIGAILWLFIKRDKIKEIGKSILGFGLLFFGMHIMSEAMYPLRTFPPFIELILTLEIPLYGILVGILMTALIQSSSAFIGILIILSMQGLLSLEAAVPLLVGANVGTAITAILASIGTTREAKQVALAHTAFKLIGAAVVIIFIPQFIDLILKLSKEGLSSGSQINFHPATARQIANIHTVYNVVLCLLFLPFTRSYAGLINKIMPVREEEIKVHKLKFLDDNLLRSPQLALKVSREELIRMMKVVKRMTERVFDCFASKDQASIDEIKKQEEEVNFLRDHIAEYLVQITRNDVSSEIIQESFILLNAVREFEQIADIVSQQLADKAVGWCKSDYEFSKKGLQNLTEYHASTLQLLQNAIKVYQSFDLNKALKMKVNYEVSREQFFELEQAHYKRLKNENEKSISSSKTHLELMTLFKMIGSHATNTARIMIMQPKAKPSKKKSKK